MKGNKRKSIQKHNLYVDFCGKNANKNSVSFEQILKR